MWVKICGNTNLEDALVAVESGAEALGFVFAESPRQVTAHQVAEITRHVPNAVERIGVFVDASAAEILRSVEVGGLSGVQLHGLHDSELAATLRSRFARRALRILSVVHYGAEFEARLARAVADPSVDAVLIDSRTATAAGGTGITFDWQAARKSIAGQMGVKALIAAGGLTPENVGEAIATLAPRGVDVSSGVERFPGRKDAARVRAFVKAARAAAVASPGIARPPAVLKV
jgi:phosphoribosylanthranilate isomerase